MSETDFKFVITGLQKLKDFFKGNKPLQNDLQYMKMLIVTLERDHKKLRQEMIKVIAENKRLKGPKC
jgi:hypothetical protein